MNLGMYCSLRVISVFGNKLFNLFGKVSEELGGLVLLQQ